MSIETDREYFLLEQLVKSPTQSVKSFKGTKTSPKGLDLDGPSKKAVELSLSSRYFITLNGKGKDKHYAITGDGWTHFKTLPPYPSPPPPPDPKLKAFVLLNLLSAGDRHVTLKQVKALAPAGVLRTLGASKENLTTVLDVLEEERAVEKSSREGASADDRVHYLLTGNGKREIMHQQQHADAVFKLSGAAINQLIELANGRPISNDTISHCMTVPAGDQAQNLIALAGGTSFCDEDLIRDAKALMNSRGRNGLLPIFELRRHVKRKYGEWAGGLEEFDKRLKRLCGHRLDMVSLFDMTAFTHDQVSEGVQGAGELFFYVRDLR